MHFNLEDFFFHLDSLQQPVLDMLLPVMGVLGLHSLLEAVHQGLVVLGEGHPGLRMLKLLFHFVDFLPLTVLELLVITTRILIALVITSMSTLSKARLMRSLLIWCYLCSRSIWISYTRLDSDFDKTE